MNFKLGKLLKSKCSQTLSLCVQSSLSIPSERPKLSTTVQPTISIDPCTTNHQQDDKPGQGPQQTVPQPLTLNAFLNLPSSAYQENTRRIKDERDEDMRKFRKMLDLPHH